jgi:S-adenosylmethionine:tRNA ribosyltransferase-isomerase
MSAFAIDPATLNFDLPDDLIAQSPLAQRDHARLMVIDRKDQSIRHQHFYDLPQFLSKDDVLVLNTAQVDRAKYLGKKTTGGKVEIILLSSIGPNRWRALVRPELKKGTRFVLEAVCEGELVDRTDIGENILAMSDDDVVKLKASAGRIPLPPYIRRDADDPRNSQDAVDYQTVYSHHPGSIAAPTAGLHFTQDLISALKEKGVDIVPILLHVGWGTFRPIAQSVETHRMLGEQYEIPKSSLETLVAAKTQGRRIVAVGTTATRVLESLPADQGQIQPFGETSLFIKPGFSFRWVNSLVTNFHVPRSTPVSLTGAFAGLSLLERAYEEAIKQKYRFFSYGDAMMIL